MLCDDCKKKPASIFYKDVSGNQIKEVHLCEDCARKRGLLLDKKLSPLEILQKLLKNYTYEDEKVICPVCFLSLAEFKKFGRFGCGNCLLTFEPYIKTMIKEVQTSEKHIGKKAKPGGRRAIEVFRLKEELRRALEKEAYEEAARIRDELKTLGVENV
jgi:protein arginine kinase activator|uniref:UVR domain-containing protein n=1 Tax=candidate division WOR-3 bacterium TaxID=2052148 RepID=A0A7V3VUE2_UNCW3